MVLVVQLNNVAKFAIIEEIGKDIAQRDQVISAAGCSKLHLVNTGERNVTVEFFHYFTLDVGTRKYIDWLAVLTENSYGLPKLLTRLEAKSL